MTPKLYVHPFSSYSWKALVALWENRTTFEYRMIEEPDARQEWESARPLARFPVLVEGDRIVFEATSIIEYLQVHYPGPVRLIPEDADAAIDVRMLDRFFDNYVMTPVQQIVGDHMRAHEARDPLGIEQAHALLADAYAWLEPRMAGRTWAAGSSFSLADCAAAPALFYGDWVHPIGDAQPHLAAYRRRLLARPSIVRAVEEARPFRHYFPPGAPDRD